MNRELVAGSALLTVGVAGYALGTARPFPGRAFSITAVMIGLLLVSIGRSPVTEGQS
ncbi:hypothetical protein [Halorientalis salina]|uniref:hypothetical protein n=1 Tax=Halorientalis salina TaxID=2932266 RepID=UPI00145E18D3|nr:hypothetical protein [Halorientalis salina]